MEHKNINDKKKRVWDVIYKVSSGETTELYLQRGCWWELEMRGMHNIMYVS